MYNRLTKWSVALSLVLFLLLFPTTTFSQTQQPIPESKTETIENAQDVGELSLDELKA